MLRKGSCKQCGECCKKMMRAVSMLRGSNFFDPDNWCKYLYQDSKDLLWYCEIREAVNEDDQELLKILPETDLRYWRENCKDYPDPSDPGNIPPLHTLLKDCGFEIIMSVR